MADKARLTRARRMAEELQCELGRGYHVRWLPSTELVEDGDYLTLGPSEGELISVDVDDDLADLCLTLDARRPEPLRQQLVSELQRVAIAYAELADDVAAGRLRPISEAERAELARVDDGILSAVGY